MSSGSEHFDRAQHWKARVCRRHEADRLQATRGQDLARRGSELIDAMQGKEKDRPRCVNASASRLVLINPVGYDRGARGTFRPASGGGKTPDRYLGHALLSPGNRTLPVWPTSVPERLPAAGWSPAARSNLISQRDPRYGAGPSAQVIPTNPCRRTDRDPPHLKIELGPWRRTRSTPPSTAIPGGKPCRERAGGAG
jgi:hypothetical protein